MKQHLLQLYDDADFMVERVVSFLRSGAEEGAGLVLIATPEHSRAVKAGLVGFDGRLHVRDAREMLDCITNGDRIDPALFDRHVGQLFEEAGSGGAVRGFGEMVALLWQDGKHDAAVRLERLWSRLSGADRYELICAYPLAAAHEHVDGAPFLAICDGHSHVFASEQVVRPMTMEGRISTLERESAALRSELSRRLDVQHMLSEADDTKDDFIAILSHELRNPLTPILTAVEMLRHPLDPDQQQRLIATIGRQTSVLARLVEDLVQARHLTAGRVSMQRSSVRLIEVIEQACETVAAMVEERQQDLQIDCSACDVTVSGDSIRLVQALSNLMVNASKFTPEGGTIRLHCLRQDGNIVVELRDTGRGMDTRFAQRAFEPYAQATVGEGGLGLGLAIVRSIIQMHGGHVEAKSPGPGLGTTIRVTLPLAHNTLKLPAAEGSSRVLVVDDNEDVRETLATLLTAYGHSTQTAASGHDALEKMRHRPHVVLLDLGMPGMDGYEVAKRIRQQEEPPLLVALSGHAPMDAALAAGFDHQFTKPPDVERLLRVVQGATRSHTSGSPAQQDGQAARLDGSSDAMVIREARET